MSTIHIFLPKKRRNDINKTRWKANHHKRPFFFTSELNKAIRNGRIEKYVAHILFRNECYTNRYKIGRWA